MWNKIEMLPNWRIPDTSPAFYDTESATAIEQTARLHDKVRELIEAYNEFVVNVEILIDEFETSATNDMETFKVGIRQEFQDFIDVVNLAIGGQETKINEAIDYMETNIVQTASNIINQNIRDGNITFETIYDPETENLTLITTTK